MRAYTVYGCLQQPREHFAWLLSHRHPPPTTQDKWVSVFDERCDDYSAAFMMYRLGQKWMSFYQSWISAIILCVTCLLFMFMPTPDSMVGMGLSNISAISFLMPFVVANMVELESRMTSVERVQYYSTQIPQGLVAFSAFRRPVSDHCGISLMACPTGGSSCSAEVRPECGGWGW